MVASRDTLRELAAQRAAINEILDARSIEARAAWELRWGRVQDEMISWADAWAEVAEALIRGGRNPYRGANLTSMKRFAEAMMREGMDDVHTIDLRVLDELIQTAGPYAGHLAASQLPRRSAQPITWRTTNPDVLAALVRRATQQITARHWHLTLDATKAVRSSLRLAAAAGDNPRRAALDMIRRTEGVFNGGLARAEVIARTELIDGYREAGALSHSANADVLAGWQWLTELSHRTCPSCIAQNGTEWPLEEPGPLDHQCGRCSRVPIIKPLRELGIGGPEPRSAVPNSRAWFEAQSPEAQLAIMGPKRFEAWRAGRYPFEAWSQRRHTEGWRDSFGVGPVPE